MAAGLLAYVWQVDAEVGKRRKEVKSLGGALRGCVSSRPFRFGRADFLVRVLKFALISVRKSKLAFGMVDLYPVSQQC